MAVQTFIFQFVQSSILLLSISFLADAAPKVGRHMFFFILREVLACLSRNSAKSTLRTKDGGSNFNE